MRINRWFWLLLVVWALLPISGMAVQTPRSAASPATASVHISNEEREATREQLFNLLRLSPRLTAVLSRDPSLLGDQEYVSRNNPELAQFLQQHPEVARNPEFYLFADRSRPGMRLEQYVYPELGYHMGTWDRVMSELIPFLAFIVVTIGLLWLLRVLLENRRWGRILKLQTDVHGKLLDKFGSNQELLTYMNTEAGKRFLEA